MITLDVKTLREALRGFGKLNYRSVKNEILKTVRFTAKGGRLTLSATDLDQSLDYACPGDQHEDSDFLIPIAKLKSACKGEKAGTRLHFHPEADRILIHIHDGSLASEISCEPLPLSKYPNHTPVPCHTLDLPAGCVRSIREATGSASNDPNRYILNSVYLQAESVVATNGRILYSSRHPKLGLKDSIIVPNLKAIDLLDPDAGATLHQPKDNPRGIHRIEQGNWTWSFRTVDGTYPNYQQVIPQDDADRVQVTLSEADLELMQRLSRLPFTGTKDAFAGLRRTGRELRLLIGQGQDLQVHQLAPDRVEGGSEGFVCFNYNFLMEGLKHGLRQLTLKDELAPVLLQDADRMQLFMPLRANLKDSDWKVTHAHQASTPAVPKPAEAPPLKAAACATKPEPSVRSSAPVDKAPEPDPVARIINEAAELRDSLKAGAQALGQLIKTAREANRERNDLEREHLALKKSVRSLQKIEV